MMKVQELPAYSTGVYCPHDRHVPWYCHNQDTVLGCTAPMVVMCPGTVTTRIPQYPHSTLDTLDLSLTTHPAFKEASQAILHTCIEGGCFRCGGLSPCIVPHRSTNILVLSLLGLAAAPVQIWHLNKHHLCGFREGWGVGATPHLMQNNRLCHPGRYLWKGAECCRGI